METPQALTVSRATQDEKPLLARLLQLYLYDFSELAEIGDQHGEIGEDGTFAYPYFDRYWIDAGRKALLFRYEGRPVGFALISDVSMCGRPTDYGVAEYFVMRKYRRIGIGKEAMHRMLADRRGIWEIAVAHYNAPGLAFWRQVMSAVVDYDVAEIAGDGERWRGPIYRLSPLARPAARG
jgi:predicted acetyltransferase